jgi:lipopolysaccharide biosynthesis regulator YciM
MSNIIITLLLLGITASAVIVYVLNYKPRKYRSNIKELYSEGLDMIINGNRRGAYQNFKSIIEKDTSNINAYLRLGQVVREGGNPEQALKIHRGLNLRKGLTHYEQVELYKNLSLDHYKRGNLENAVEQSRNILKIDKSSEWALTHLVKYFREMNDWSQAGEYLESLQKVTQKPDSRKLALFKIQEGRVFAKNSDFIHARSIYEEALNIDSAAAAAYYFIGKSYSQESEGSYQKAVKADEGFIGDEHSPQYQTNLDEAKQLLGKAIPMWIRYCESRPQQAWMVIHLLKDALFALDRYPEMEKILKTILQNDSNNIEVIASLADIYAQRGENSEALEFIDSALEKDNTSLLVRLIKLKLQARAQSGGSDMTRELDEIIHFLVTDKQFQRYKNTSRDSDVLWLYEASGDDIPE